MNPGAVEEGGKVANTIVTALGSHPMALALIVSNMALLAFIFYQGANFAETRNQNIKLYVEEQHRVNDLLARCVVPRGEK